MKEIRREDGELCGFVAPADAEWRALTVFGAVLGIHGTATEATRHVVEVGLASLAGRWVLTDAGTGHEEVVCIREARPGSVSVDIGFYPEPGVPARTIASADLDAGRWRLEPMQ